MKKKIWVIDKYFLPEPIVSKNRYKIFYDLPNTEVIFFHSGVSEYGQKLRKEIKLKVQKHYKNSKWEKVPSISLSKVLLYMSFSINLFFKGLFKEKPDVIIASCPDPLQAYSGMILAKIKKSKYIVDFRDYWPELLVKNNKIKKSSFVYRLLFWITSQLSKYADAIISVDLEDTKKYLKNRSVFQKKISIRKNIYINIEEYETLKYPVGKNYSKVKKFYEESKRKNKIVLMFTGRLNVKSEDRMDIIKLMLSCNEEISLVVLSNNTEDINLFKNCNISETIYLNMLERKEYLSILNIVDSLISFVTVFENGFSSNKIMDSLAIGTPVIIGNYFNVKTENLFPGVFAFDIREPRTFKKVIKDVANIKNDLGYREYMRQFALDLYNEQANSFSNFLNMII